MINKPYPVLRKIKILLGLVILLFIALGKANAQPHCKILIFLFPDLCNPGQITLETVVFGNATPPYSYAWSTGETTPSISIPYANGTYSVTLTDGVGCMDDHEVVIDIANFTYYIEAYNLCPGEEINLIVEWNGYEEPTNAQYQWSNGQTTKIMTTPTPGYYEVTVTDPATGCSQVLSTTVNQLPGPEVEITGPLTICTGETITLTASGGPFEGVYWAPGGETTESIEVTTPGSYDVAVYSSNNCFDYDTVIVVSSGVLPQVNGPLYLCNGQNGTLTLLNASEFADILWSTGDITPSTTVSAPGTYVVTVTDPNGCMAEGYGEVFSGILDLTGTANPVTSCNPPNGSVDLTVLTPGSFTFSWSNGATSEDLNGLPQGNYSVTVSDGSGCSAEASFLVDIDVQLPSLSANAVATICTLSIGSITLMVNPPGSYTYEWSNGATTQNLNNLPEGTYSVTVTDAAGCANTLETNVIAASNAISITNVVENDNTSCGPPNGSLEAIMLSPGNYSFLWSNGGSSQTINNLPAGTYTVTATDPAGCISTSAGIVVNNINLPVLQLIPQPALCANPFGNITSNVSPAGNYSYLWSSGETTPNLTDVPPGTYSLTVTDGNGCTDEASATILSNNSGISFEAELNPNTLCVGGNGSIVLTITSSSPYIVLWDDGSTGSTLPNLSGGQYFATITNTDGCVVETDFYITNEPIYPTITGTSTNSMCGANTGSIDVTVSPASSYTYSWSNGQTTEDISNLEVGIYTITVTDINSCQAVESFAISGSTDLTVSAATVNNTACSTPNGSIDLTITASNTYTVMWSTGATTEDIGTLGAGQYQVTITESNGCITLKIFDITTITQPPKANARITPANCTAPNGAIQLKIISGSNLSFKWSNGSMGQNLINVPGGIYMVTITDGLGCFTVLTDTIPSLPAPYWITGNIIQNTSCATPNGSIQTLVGGGFIGSWLWSTGQTTADIFQLQAGNYSLTITDVFGCKIDTTFAVSSDLIFPALTSEIDSVDCSGQNGSINLHINASGTHQILWSNGATDTLINGLTTGTYYVTITNDASCSVSDTFILAPPVSTLMVQSLVTHVTSCIADNGSIQLSANQGGNVGYLWSNGLTTKDISNLSPGNYIVTVTDTLGCSQQLNFEILNQKNQPVVNFSMLPSYCGQNNGSILLNTTPATGLTYLWNDGITQANRSQLAAGFYSVTVSLTNGCKDTASIQVTEILFSPQVDAVVSHHRSCLYQSGSIAITVSPSASDYVWLWSNGHNSPKADSLAPGLYRITITNTNGCSVEREYEILNQVSFPSLSLSPAMPTCGQANGSIVLATPQSGNVSYLWSDAYTLKDRFGLLPGYYSVTITDDQGCMATDSITLFNQAVSFLYDIAFSHNSSCLDPNGKINVDTTGNQVNLTLKWSNGQETNHQENLAAGTYHFTLSDATGCTQTDSITLTNQFVYPDIFYVLHPGDCDNNRQYLIINAPIDTSHTYLWDDREIDPSDTLTSLVAGLHTLAVRTALGCQKDTMVLVETWTNPALDVPVTIVLALNESREINVKYSGFNHDDIFSVEWAPYQFLIFKDINIDAALNPTIAPDAEGTLLLTIQLQNGCIIEKTIEIRRSKTYTTTFPNIISPTQGGTSNNRFYPISPDGDVKTILYLNIYDRWGNLMFRKENFDPNVPDNGWDGNFSGCAVLPGVYVWIAEVLFADESQKLFKGDLTVVR